jgi:hypothetical protein
VSSALGKPFDEVRDGENNPIEFDVAYPLGAHPEAAVAEARRRHGDDIHLLPISGSSAGGGIFQAAARPPGTVVGLRFDPPAQAAVRVAADADLERLGPGEIVVDTANRQVLAGAAVTLEQLSRAVAEHAGLGCRVPGADLTSYQYAAAGATFMTGGMGPQRRYFSDSVVEAAIFDGAATRVVSGDELRGYAGTYGWSGLVCALRCNYYRFPRNEIAFALPTRQTPDELARLLARLGAYVYLDLDGGQVRSTANADDLILGIEHVSARSMAPLLRDAADNAITARARQLRQKMTDAGADSLLFVNGCSARDIDDFLLGLADENARGEYSIAGVDLEHAEVFGDPEEMRAVREAIPYAARMQQPAGRLVYKNHTDADLRLVAERVEEGARRLWEINCAYVAALEDYFATRPEISGEILVYGHLNPYGVDPHNRVTLAADDEQAFGAARAFVVEQRAHFYRELAALCESGLASFVGGEKTADSELAIYAALRAPARAPVDLYRRFQLQRDAVCAARPLFNWRAPPLFRSR